MSLDDPDITDPVDVARLAFSAEDGVTYGNLTWQSYVDTDVASAGAQLTHSSALVVEENEQTSPFRNFGSQS